MTDPIISKLPKRRFGRLGWSIAPVGLGGAWLHGAGGRKNTPEESAQLVLDAVDLGLDYIDTSINYGDSELFIGEAYSRLAPERRPILATKTKVIREGDSADLIYASCLASLERLRLPKVDLLQLHEAECYGDDRILGPRGALVGLQRCRAEGLCDGIGITGRDVDLLARMVDTGEFDSVLTYLEYDLATANAARELMPAAARHDVAVIAGSPARMGMFAGDGLLARWEQQPEPIKFMREKLEGLFGVPVGQMAPLSTRFLLADPRVTNINVGSSRLSSLRSSVEAALLGPLPAEQVARIRTWQAQADPAWPPESYHFA